VDEDDDPGVESLLDEHPAMPPTSAAAVALKTARRIAVGTTLAPNLVVNC
jgi:hypothetical protein